MNDARISDVGKAELTHRRWRIIKDRLFGGTMAFGGVAVIAALLTIFLYLLWVVAPLFMPASITTLSSFQSDVKPAHLSLNEHGDLAFLVGPDGHFRFVDAADGKVRKSGALLPAGTSLQAGLTGYRTHGPLALGLADGRALLVQSAYRSTFINNQRGVDPSLSYPLGQTPLTMLPKGGQLRALTAATDGTTFTLAAVSTEGDLVMAHAAPATGLVLDPESAELETTVTPIERLASDTAHVLVNNDQQQIFTVSSSGSVSFFDIRDKTAPRRVETVQVVGPDMQVTDARLLAGGHSLLIGDSTGRISQWFPVRDPANNLRLTRVREFTALHGAISQIEPEYYRKAFAAMDAGGTLGLFHTTSERTLLIEQTGLTGARALSYSPRAEHLMAFGEAGDLRRWQANNHHPEVSWHSLWEKVWYEGRSGPEFIWQSSSASSDFEPKFSLTPLVFGTIKAAFYALFFAIPLAICGAIYTAYFMHPRMRAVVKPSIEIMAALPTVILGFLAGLWLAPLIESHLMGVLAATVLLPLSVVLASALFSVMPVRVQGWLPPGRETLLIIPLLSLVLWGVMEISQPLEQLWFGGNLPRWLTQEFGITYDQRNSLVVGIAMGFAVIPNIFSISEDAVFAVPRQLTTGSLALGATPWQTLSRVVLLTASPGIFSGVMIGLGRAVGETMIVLMSTGNTPVMDLSIFQGFRALSANIAVEMPESELNSTHYRVLFLAALVLFLTTFVFNTVAEVVRQRLRRRYGNL